MPVAWFKCYYTIDDYNVLTSLTTEFAETADTWGDMVTIFFWNIFFNWVDVTYESITLRRSYENRDWTMIGTYGAKMVSDVAFKNPEDESWNYKNSDVLVPEWGAAPSF